MIKEKDFIELHFTGKVEDDDFIFDTTEPEKAKEAGLEGNAGPKIVCIGTGMLLKGLEKDIIGKETGKDYEVKIPPEDGFGKKSAKLIQLIPTSRFKKENIDPVPGLQVNIDNQIGIIKTVTGGRTLVDFNHPLSSKDLVYEYRVTRIITDTKEKAEAYLRNTLGLPAELEVKEKELIVTTQFPLGEMAKEIEKKILEVIPELEKVTFKEDKPEPKKEAEKAARAEPDVTKE